MKQGGVKAFDFYTFQPIDPWSTFSDEDGKGMQYWITFDTYNSLTLGWYAYRPKQ